MFKVMIVDDELLVRIGIRSTIAWEENGFEIIGDAPNGEEAFQMFLDKRPDVVITDIKMPKIDGIELIRRIREISRNTGIILLTCYEEMNYMKNAIQLGANDYLIKATMEPDDLLRAVTNVRRNLEANLKEKNEMEDIKRELERQRPKVQSLLLKDLLKGNIGTDKSAEEALRDCGIVFENTHFIILYFRIDDFRLKYSGSSVAEKQTIKKSVVNMIGQVIEEGCGYIFDLEESDFACLLCLALSQVKAMEYGKGLIGKMKTIISNYTSVTVSVAISRYVNSLADLPPAFSETRDYINYKVFFGKNGCITYSDIQKLECRKYEADFETNQEEIKKALRTGDFEQVKGLIEGVFSRIGQASNSLAFLDYACIQFISLLNNMCSEYLFDPPCRGGRTPNHYTIGEIQTFDSLEDIRGWFIDQFTALCGHISGKKYAGSSFVIRKAIDYIGRNCARPVTLGEVAEYVNISRTYFCQVFKQETGENFVDYLNRIRIENAKQLLKETDLRNYEIADKAGFSDNTYFCRIFKQVEGITPAEYRKQYSE